LTEDITFRYYRPGDEKGIVDLLRDAFGEWPKVDISCSRIDYWRWKYTGSPFSDTGEMVVVAEDADKIIGVCSMSVYPVQLAGENTLFAYAGDHAVSKDYRGRGLSGRLIEENRVNRDKLGIKYTYFVTQNPILVKSYNKRYHVFPVPIINMVRIDDVELQLSKIPMEYEWLMKTGYKALQYANRVMHKPTSSYSSLEIESPQEFPEEVDQLFSAHSLSGFMVNNCRDYLNWRFCDPRAGPYRILMAMEDGGLLGYVVSRVNRFIEDYPIGYIVDLLAKPGEKRVVEFLLQSALTEMDQQDINIVLSMIPKGHMYEPCYAGQGFVDSRRNLHLYTNLNTWGEEAKLESLDPDQVHFNFGSIDSLPVNYPNI
jgi:GNAT superfamily N-acetyltransferase